jgi:hypothetical protein
VDDLLTTLGVLVMIEQQVVLWSLTIYKPPTLAVFYVSVVSSPTVIWYVHPSCSCCSTIAIYAFFSFVRLSRGAILASVIRIIPGGPLRSGALYVSGLFVMLYILTIAQIVWVCQMDEERDYTGYVSFCGSHFRIVPVSYCY